MLLHSAPGAPLPPQDVASAACPLPGGESLPEGTFPSLFCVFDGHCGRAAAEEANTLLPDQVAARLPGGQGGCCARTY